MRLIYKHLLRQIAGYRIFLSLLLLLTILSSCSFFFVRCSIDGNMAMLEKMTVLSENQLLYRNALNSNTVLARAFLLSSVGLTSLVFVMFFYRFFRAGEKQIGCIKALGIRNGRLQFFFAAITMIFSEFGSVLGLVAGYVMSDILINANSRAYAVTGLVKGLNIMSLVTGLIFPGAVFALTAASCFGFVRNKEAGLLLSGSSRKSRGSVTLKAADRISRIAPPGMRLSLRIALRKPLSVLLLLGAVMSFLVCIILGQSLHISSRKVFDSQTRGHNYEYDIHFSQYCTGEAPEGAMTYMDGVAVLMLENHELERRVIGLYNMNELYELSNASGDLLSVPNPGRVYISPELSEIYGVKIGASMDVSIGGLQRTFIVEEIAVNAQSGSIYINGSQMTEITGALPGAYNGMLSETAVSGGTVVGRQERMEELNRNAVSNQVSGVINQVIGIMIGIVLIFLALYMNVQDNIHDILILNMLGQHTRDIRKLLIDVYLPVLCIAFLVTLMPAIILAREIQNSLSISTNDYMPFGVNGLVVIVGFLVLCLIYQGVQATFYFGVKRVMAKEQIADVIYGE